MQQFILEDTLEINLPFFARLTDGEYGSSISSFRLTLIDGRLSDWFSECRWFSVCM